MSDKKKKKRKHFVRAVNPAQPVTSTPNTGYSGADDQAPTDPGKDIRKLKSRLLR